MVSFQAILLIAVVAASTAYTFRHKPRNRDIRRLIPPRLRHHTLVPPPKRAGRLDGQEIIKKEIEQPLDHFDPHNNRFFSQKYWINDEFYKPGGPAFLWIAGSDSIFSPESYIRRAGTPIYELAKSQNAMMFLIEHRFWGDALGITTELLQYLTSRQAIEDTADLIKLMNQQFGFKKWITFGGDYGGSLSAWIRETHPELVTGAIASSAPMLAKFDFFELFEGVEKMVTNYSPVCAANIKKAFEEFQILTRTVEGVKKLNETIRLCRGSYSAEDISMMYESFVGQYANPVFEDGQSGIESICKFHTNDGTPPLAQMSKFILENEYEDCADSSYDKFIEMFGPDAKYPMFPGVRLTYWPECNEFGHFELANQNGIESMFGFGLPNSYYVKFCADVFGPQFNNETMFYSIASTNSHYGGKDNFKGTRVVLTNGLLDPYNKLGIMNSKFPDYTAVGIRGAMHCEDMMAATANDSKALTEARETIAMNVATWLYN